MNVVQSSRRRTAILQEPSGEDANQSGVNFFYKDPPNFELSLDEFEEFALARLKVLRKIEELKVRNVTGDAFRLALDSTLKAQGLTRDEKKNSASHFILRAAYCRTEELRRWFLTHESHLFRHRMDALLASPQKLQAFLQTNIPDLKPMSLARKEELRDDLLCANNTSPAEFASTPYYAIPFAQALELVAHRSCLVKKGIAYVPVTKIVSTLAAKFRMNLSKSLALASLELANVLEEKSRIAPLLKNMNSQYTASTNDRDSNLPGGHELTAASIDMYAERNMPLCMSQLHKGLVQDSKLRHWGRLQYGLFLKGAGMSMEESTLFFQRIFTKIMTTDAFNKNYSYNIRHMYGKEGKRASYTPYNCMKIIMGQAPTTSGEHHGCPYRHYDADHLSALLAKMKVGTPQDRAAILREKKAGNYQLACVKQFQAMHPNTTVPMEGVGNHPNAWFAASVAHVHGDKVKSDHVVEKQEK